MILQVAVVEVVEAGVGADQSGLGDRSDEEHRRGRAVVGPARGILRDPAAELAEGQHGDPVGLAGGGRSSWNAAIESDSSVSSAAWVPSWLAWVSKPSSDV